MTLDPELIVFNRTHVTGNEFEYMREAIGQAHLASGGRFSQRCAGWLCEHTRSRHALLTHSCTAALELAYTLAGVGPGDEVVMPSFTFVTTANAAVAHGAQPIFVDIREDTLCLDDSLIEPAITARTKAIVPVHYAGVAPDMSAIMELARAHDLVVVEDAAQGVGATVAGAPLGGIGHLGALSFHETKNVTCGEGGALLVNDERFVDRAEIVLEKGTDRRKYARGEVDKYTWVDVGSSYGMSELAAAYLWAQLENESEIRAMRLELWNAYDVGLSDLEEAGFVRRPVVPDACAHNAHMYYLLVEDLQTRKRLIAHLAERGINAVFHYVPLHSSPAGRRYARTVGRLERTTALSDRLVRLPLWVDLGVERLQRVVDAVHDFYKSTGPTSPRARDGSARELERHGRPLDMQTQTREPSP